MSISAQREAQLAAWGWTRQTLINEPRLSEIVQEYRELGFEVHLESIDPKSCRSSGECTACFDNPKLAAQFKVVFTRPIPGGGGDSDSP